MYIMNEHIATLTGYGLPREVAEKIDMLRRRMEFRENRVLPFEAVSEFAIGVRIDPLSYLDGKGIDIFSGVSHNTFIGFVYSKKGGYTTIAWGGIYEDIETNDEGVYIRDPDHIVLDDEEWRTIARSLSAQWIRIANKS